MPRTTVLALLFVSALAAAEPLPEPSSVLGDPGMRHVGPSHALAFSPDGRTLASGGYDKTVRLWDVATGRERRRFAGHAQYPTQVGFSADGRTVFAAHARGVQWWEVITGRERLGTGDPTSFLPGTVFSPDGKIAATRQVGREERRIRLLDVETGQVLRLLEGHTADPGAFAFSPDGKRFVSCARDESTRLWEVATGKQLARWPGYDQMPGTLVFSPTGKHIAAAGYGGSARVHDLEGKILASRVVVVPPGRTIAFRPDGKVLAVAVGKEVETWDWAADKVLRRWEVSAGPLPLSALAYSPDGKTLATAQHGAAIRLWDADTGTPKGGREGSGHDRSVAALYWHPGGEKLFSVGEDETVRTWDVAARKTIHVLDRLPKTVVAVAVSPDGRLIASASEKQDLGVWDAVNGKRLWDVEKDGEKSYPWAASFTPDGKRLAVADSGGPVRLFDVESRKEVSRLVPPRFGVHPLVFSPDGRYLSGVSRDGTSWTLYLWDLAAGGPPRRISGANFQPRGVLFSRDGRMMIVQAAQTLLFETATGQQRLAFQAIGPASLSPDGRYLAASSGEGLAVWDLAVVLVTNSWEHTGNVTAVAWRGDGKAVAAGAADGVTRVWDRAAVLTPPVPKLKPLTAEVLEQLWVDLGAAEGAKSFGAMRNLSLRPREALPMLKERAGSMVTGKQIEAWIAELDNDDIKVRERGEEMLARQKGVAAEAMRKAMEGAISLEQRRRLRKLLERLDAEKVVAKTSGEAALRALRAVEVLERLATPEARALLEEWAEGKGAAMLTAGAKAALARSAPSGMK